MITCNADRCIYDMGICCIQCGKIANCDCVCKNISSEWSTNKYLDIPHILAHCGYSVRDEKPTKERKFTMTGAYTEITLEEYKDMEESLFEICKVVGGNLFPGKDGRAYVITDSHGEALAYRLLKNDKCYAQIELAEANKQNSAYEEVPKNVFMEWYSPMVHSDKWSLWCCKHTGESIITSNGKPYDVLGYASKMNKYFIHKDMMLSVMLQEDEKL